MRSQSERLIDALRAAGPAGVKTTDFLGPDVIDRGKPILRLPSRVNDLRDAGHTITTYREPNRTARYVLVRDAEDVAATLRATAHDRPPTDEVNRMALFDAPPGQTAACSPYDPWEGNS